MGRYPTQEGLAHRLGEAEGGVETGLAVGAEVVEEQPAHAARLVAVLEEEVAVAPVLEAGVFGLAAPG
jgi:hypothetical protein